MNAYLLSMLVGSLACAVALGWKLKKPGPAALNFLLSWVLSLIGAKLFYCLMFPRGTLLSGVEGLFRTSIREYSFFGGCFGALLGAGLTARITGMQRKEYLDAFAPMGALMVCFARCAEYFLDLLGVGGDVYTPFFMRFPFAVVNEWDEWYAALFMLEALLALVVAVVFLRKKKEDALPGLRVERVAFYLCLPQILMESLRAECLRWGFVRCEQLLCAITVVGILLYSCLKAASGGFFRRFWPVLASLLCIAALVGIEFALDRIDLPNLLWYALMVLVLLALALLERYGVQRRLKQAGGSSARKGE